MISKKRITGGMLGILGIAIWAVSIFAEAPIHSNRFEFFLKLTSSFSFNVYPLPLTFGLFAVVAFLGKRISMIALAVLAVVISVSYVYAGSRDLWTIILDIFSVFILLFSIFCGRGARI